MRIISPSMLAADFGNLERDTKMVERSAAQWVHIDVMDGSFVPNISYGFPVMAAIARHTTKVLDVHLMIVHPERFVERFVEAGAGVVTFHLEATEQPLEVAELIRKSGVAAGRDVKVGVSVKPATPLAELEPLLAHIDLVLIMSVEPGFGGQKYIDGSTQRVAQIREIIDQKGLDVIVEVDGGIGADNAREIFDAGADVVVVGSSIFGKQSPEEEIVKILES